jgi:hypothetical protein
MKSANMAPVYVGIYGELAELCRECGYALAVHGSLAKDFDLIAVPWVERPFTPDELVEKIVGTFALRVVGEPNSPKLHGRLCTTMIVSFGECYLDFSVMKPDPTHAE